MPDAPLRVMVVDDETLHERVALAATRVRLPVHHVTVQHLGDRLGISLDFEVPGDMPLGMTQGPVLAVLR